MDPLGAQPSITEAKDLPRWDADQSSIRLTVADSTASPYSSSPFPVRRDLNRKIAFWQVTVGVQSGIFSICPRHTFTRIFIGMCGAGKHKFTSL